MCKLLNSLKVKCNIKNINMIIIVKISCLFIFFILFKYSLFSLLLFVLLKM